MTLSPNQNRFTNTTDLLVESSIDSRVKYMKTMKPKTRKTVFENINLMAIIGMIILSLSSNVECLKDLKIFVPEAVIMGNAATLSCQYDLEEAALYSVRWYFETEEFYRYVPKESPPTLVFPVSGINVDLTNSDATSVTLKGVTRELTGSYQCEVSEDAPLFHTDIRSSHMQVIELPKDEPTMQVDKKMITINDNFKAVCTVGPSYPPANITWYINGRKVYKNPFQRVTQNTYDGAATYSSLEIFPHSQVMQGFFTNLPKQTISLLCEVSILHVFHKNVQQRITLSLGAPTTISPNLLGLEGSKRYNGDPDNSALTGGIKGQHNPTFNFNHFLLLLLPTILLQTLTKMFATKLAQIPENNNNNNKPATTTTKSAGKAAAVGSGGEAAAVVVVAAAPVTTTIECQYQQL